MGLFGRVEDRLFDEALGRVHQLDEVLEDRGLQFEAGHVAVVGQDAQGLCDDARVEVHVEGVHFVLVLVEEHDC